MLRYKSVYMWIKKTKNLYIRFNLKLDFFGTNFKLEIIYLINKKNI